MQLYDVMTHTQKQLKKCPMYLRTSILFVYCDVLSIAKFLGKRLRPRFPWRRRRSGGAITAQDKPLALEFYNAV